MARIKFHRIGLTGNGVNPRQSRYNFSPFYPFTFLLSLRRLGAHWRRRRLFRFRLDV